MYAGLPQRLRELIDELVDLEVRIRELDNSSGEFGRKKLSIERIGVCRKALGFCKAHDLKYQVVNAAFFERLGRKVTNDGIL